MCAGRHTECLNGHGRMHQRRQRGKEAVRRTHRVLEWTRSYASAQAAWQGGGETHIQCLNGHGRMHQRRQRCKEAVRRTHNA
eukprot:365455-Chlamydomonas_euryale.AAC.29